jgi:lipopolysaccharide/colanic/teichoic acid biosynthesis glycosyltransferase
MNVRFFLIIICVLVLINRIIALLLLFMLSPFILVLILLIKINLGSPIFFKQSRTGLNGVVFTMTKFRTMLNNSDTQEVLLDDSYRLTKFGKFLRSTSLDELPELWNVFKGNMDLVGPRPLLVEYLPLYSNQQFRRHEVKPGITGWAQVNGRNAISWEERFDLDIWYVDNKSILLDMKILLMTFVKVFNREGINSDNHSTMPYFYGKLKKDIDA